MRGACEVLREDGVDVRYLSVDAALLRIRQLLDLNPAAGPSAILARSQVLTAH